MRKYETIFIINPDLSEEDTKGVIEKARNIIQGLRGEVLKIEEWGKKKLAYEIKKMSRGFFVLLHFTGTPQVLTELERNLRLMDAVLKYQTVRLDEKKDKAQEAPPEEEKTPEERAEPEIEAQQSSQEGEPRPESPQPETADTAEPGSASGKDEPDRTTGEETGS
ncbi:MAG: 30S ribosomal protein S6 [Deltaproteobacteria bacterium]|nr:30S ribosomal protein S6 [Deltaproteobacteria bacterium]